MKRNSFGKIKLFKVVKTCHFFFVNTNILKPIDFVEKTTDMASLKIGAVPHSDERYIAKLQFFQIEIHWYKDNFFPVKAVILLFSNLKPRRPPGGFPKLYFSLKFWLSFKKCWKNDNIAHLKIGADPLFDGRYVTKPKIFSKQDRGIIFFRWKLRCSFFQIWNPGGLPKLYFGLKILYFFENFEKFQNFISK